MQVAKFHGWTWMLAFLISACIGQDSWHRWASVHPSPELGPMRRMKVVVEDGWQSRGTMQSDEYRAALLDALAKRGVELGEDVENVDATLVIHPWVERPRGRGRTGSLGSYSAGVNVQIHRTSDRQRLFSGRFIGGPIAAGEAISELVVRGRVDEI